ADCIVSQQVGSLWTYAALAELRAKKGGPGEPGNSMTSDRAFAFFSKNSGDIDNEGVQASALPEAGDASQPILYLEFRKDGVPVDPGPWWAVNEGQKVRG